VLSWDCTGTAAHTAVLRCNHQTTPGGAKHLIDFTNYDGSYSGAGPGQRMWRILPTLTGWRLEFRDPGDRAATYAGTFGTLHAAQREAAR
jgi:hypothetical protein